MNIDAMLRPARRQRYAISSVKELLWSPGFWLAQPYFLSLLVASLIALLVLAPYTYEFAGGWVFLTLVIHLLTGWGAFYAANSLAKIEVERAILAEVESKGADYLRAVKAGRLSRIDLDHLEETILPHNQSTPPPAMIRLFQNICKEARDRRFESSVSVIQPYRDEVIEDIFRLQNLQKITLWLGILGTFVGMILALQAVDWDSIKTDDGFLSVLKGMFDALFVSFSASLAGLEAAVILGFLLLALRSKQQDYFKAMENVVLTMLSLARNAINKDDFLSEFSQINVTVSDLSDRVNEQTKELSDRMIRVQSQIKVQTDQIDQGITKLTATGIQFDRFLHQVSNIQQEFINDVKGVYDSIALNKLGTVLQQTIAESGTHLSIALTTNLNQVTDQLARFNDIVKVANDTRENQMRLVAEHIDELEKQMSAQSMGNTKVMEQVAHYLKSMNSETSITTYLRAEIGQLSKQVRDLVQIIERSKLVQRRRTVREFLTDTFARLS
ncbi:MAG: hypothetical protein HY231_03445 [Acidobacteria bacterium]|nr:hypothetical protein [Acidobacteriota bacterium]